MIVSRLPHSIHKVEGDPHSRSCNLAPRMLRLLRCMGLLLAVRLEGANHQWRKIPPGELSIDPEADERLGRVTGWAGAS